MTGGTVGERAVLGGIRRQLLKDKCEAQCQFRIQEDVFTLNKKPGVLAVMEAKRLQYHFEHRAQARPFPVRRAQKSMGRRQRQDAVLKCIDRLTVHHAVQCLEGDCLDSCERVLRAMVQFVQEQAQAALFLFALGNVEERYEVLRDLA